VIEHESIRITDNSSSMFGEVSADGFVVILRLDFSVIDFTGDILSPVLLARASVDNLGFSCGLDRVDDILRG